MSQRTADLYLVDVIDAADAIARSVRGLSSDEFAGQQGFVVARSPDLATPRNRGSWRAA
jgi:hypothetical protein